MLHRKLYPLATVILLISSASFTAQSLDTNEVDDDTSNPFMDIASSLLQGSLDGGNGGGGLAALGGILGNLMQGDGSGAKNIGDMLVGMQSGKNSAAGEVLANLGSLFTNKDGNLDPNLLGSMISVFAESAMKQNEEVETKPVKKNASPLNQGRPNNHQPQKQQRQQDGGLDMNNILSMASAFLGSQNPKESEPNPMAGIAAALPLLLNTFNSFSGPEAEERAHKHADHAWFLPPLFEKVHVFWDHFINSDLGKTVWENAGLSELTKTFMDKEGKLDFEVILKSLENHSFRRRWIKSATNYLAEWVVHVANPEVQQRYLSSGQFVVNGFLKSQGFPKHAMFQPAKFSESVSSITNYVSKKYLNTPMDVSIYVKPAVNYMKDILKTAQTTGSYLTKVNQNELSDKLTDTLNLEIIEPILRVYRAYRFAHKHPHCHTHVLCTINRHDPSEKLGLPGFKVGLTKLSSFVASVALSYQGGHEFLDLYTAIQDDSNCRARYPADCDEFHEDEIKVTTEYYHNEL